MSRWRWRKEGRSHGLEDNRCALYTIYINMWTVSSDVSIQRRHWQPPSVHLWAYCTLPTHDVNDVWRLATPPGSTSPPLFEQWCGFFYVPQEPDKCECCETWPTVFRPYPRGLERLTVCRCHYKGSIFFSLFKDPECWFGWGLNPWPPVQQTNAYPTDPTRWWLMIWASPHFGHPIQKTLVI